MKKYYIQVKHPWDTQWQTARMFTPSLTTWGAKRRLARIQKQGLIPAVDRTEYRFIKE